MASPKKSGKTRHSYVQFYPSDWLAGTARMPRLVKSVYFDICLYNWDKAEPVPESEIMLMLADLEAQGDAIVNALVRSKKLVRDEGGDVYCQRALDEARRALDMWTAKSKGGKNKPQYKENEGQNLPSDMQESSEESSATLPIEPEPEPEPEIHNPPSGEVVSLGENDPVEGEEFPDLDVADRAKAGSIVVAWNKMARAHGLTQVAKMTGQRPSKLKARIRDHGVTAIVTGIDMIPKSPFLMGKNDRQWKANFDWLLRPDACTKLIEGGYHNDGEGVSSAWRN